MRAGLTPHAPYTVDLPGYRKCLQLARERAMPLATHLAESSDERAFLESHAGPFREAWERIGSWAEPVQTFGGSPIEFAESIGLLEYLIVHGRARGFGGDAERRDMTQDTYPPATTDENLSSRARERHPPVVERAFVRQPLNGCIDIRAAELPSRQPRPELGLGQLPPRKQLEPDEVGIRQGHSLSVSQRPCRRTDPDNS